MRPVAALICAASLLTPRSAPAAGVTPPAASPFETVAQPEPAPRSYLGAYLTLAAGAALVGASFEIQRRADRSYDRYLEETDPARIEQLYGRTLAYDRWGRAALLGGEALVAAGLYLRFLHHPAPQRAMLEWSPRRCAVSVRF